MLAIEHDPAATGEGWGGFAGNAKAVRTIRNLCRKARESGEGIAFLLDGESGIGKSLAARLAATVDLGADDRADDVHITPSGQLSADEVEVMRDRFSHTTLFGSGWRVWIIEEIDFSDARQIRRLLTILDHLPRRCAVFMTTNVKVAKDSLFEERRASLPAETEKALLGRAYGVSFTKEGLGTEKGGIGPGPRRVKEVGQRLGINGRSDGWYVRHFQESHASIREALNRLAVVAAADDTERGDTA
jgi:hypothetical protein